jgi:hypothetical protein
MAYILRVDMIDDDTNQIIHRRKVCGIFNNLKDATMEFFDLTEAFEDMDEEYEEDDNDTDYEPDEPDEF